MKKSLLIIFIVLLIDQVVKIWIKTTMMLGEEHVITNWFIIHFTENNGMAFGMELNGEFGKITLSLFRIVAVSGIGYYLWYCIKHQANNLFIASLSLIFAGALGNIIDSSFYGLIFNESDYEVAKLFPKEGGYSSFLHGKVVDMLYFPLFHGTFPKWLPIWGGEPWLFFRPVFNISDAAISTGVFLIFIFQKKMFAHHEQMNENKPEEISMQEQINESETTKNADELSEESTTESTDDSSEK